MKRPRAATKRRGLAARLTRVIFAAIAPLRATACLDAGS
jgi:hypothetical protein